MTFRIIFISVYNRIPTTMYTSLLSYILLTSSTNHWVTQNSWNCLEDSLGYFLDTIAVSSDVDIKNLFGKPIYRKGTTFFPKYLKFDDLLIYRSMGDWQGRDLRGKVIILTESLNDIDQIWTRFKIAHLLVLLQTNQTCEIYTWYPYKPGSCHKPPELIHLTTCVNGKFPTALNFSFDENFLNMTGCPLVAALANCPLLVSDGKEGMKIGPEVDILNDIARQHGMKLVQNVHDTKEYFANQKSRDLLMSRDIDIAASCLSISTVISETNFEFLPSHNIEHVTWFFPGPVQNAVAFGAFNTLHYKVWIATIITYILYFTLASCIHSIPYSISWTTAHMFSIPTPPLGTSTRLRIISVLFEIVILIITVSYKTMLLINLSIDTEFVYSSAQQASEHGLTALIQPDPFVDFKTFDEYFRQKDFVPKKFEYVNYYDYNLLAVNRSHMILNLQLFGEIGIRTLFPNLSYSEIVSTQEEADAIVFLVFFMPPHHPLHDVLSDSVLNVLEVGMPAMYIKNALDAFPGGGHKAPGDKHRQPLNIYQFLSLFMIFFMLLAFSLVVCCLEVTLHRYL